MTKRGNDAEERSNLVAALVVILKGESSVGSGQISVKCVAEQAGVARTLLTHKHRDLKELIELCRDGMKHTQSSSCSKRITDLQAQVDDLKSLNEVLTAHLVVAAASFGNSDTPKLSIVPL